MYFLNITHNNDINTIQKNEPNKTKQNGKK